MTKKPKLPDATFGGIFQNATGGEMSFLSRWGTILMSIPRRFRRVSFCCGHYGEPGC